VKRLRWTLALFAWLSLAAPAGAHPFAPALLELRELGADRVSAHWKEPALRAQGSRLQPVLPGGCRGVGKPSVEREGTAMEATWEIECPQGLSGQTVGVQGIASSGADVLLRIQRLDGRQHSLVLTADSPELRIPAAPDRLGVFRTYVGLGFEHIFAGYDHLLFVAGLTLLVGLGRRLAWTITAFTLGHSVTLALAALGYVDFSPHAIEVGIAASLYFLALELAGVLPRTVLRSHPWSIPALFGLLHGLGFAGALAKVGLPHGEIPLALLSFNVGIETGQLAFVGIVLVSWALVETLRIPTPLLRRASAYAIGSLAILWVLERL